MPDASPGYWPTRAEAIDLVQAHPGDVVRLLDEVGQPIRFLWFGTTTRTRAESIRWAQVCLVLNRGELVDQATGDMLYALTRRLAHLESPPNLQDIEATD